jgi:hypothetical protein
VLADAFALLALGRPFGELLDQVLRDRDAPRADTGTTRLRESAEFSLPVQM